MSVIPTTKDNLCKSDPLIGLFIGTGGGSLIFGCVMIGGAPGLIIAVGAILLLIGACFVVEKAAAKIISRID